MYLAHRSRSLRELASYTRLKAMPDLALGLMIGEADADSHIPPIGVDGALQVESGPFLNTEDGNILAFD